jgi:hypothetical protein
MHNLVVGVVPGPPPLGGDGDSHDVPIGDNLETQAGDSWLADLRFDVRTRARQPYASELSSMVSRGDGHNVSAGMSVRSRI